MKFHRLLPGLALGAFLLTACGGPAYHSQVMTTPENKSLAGHQRPYQVNGQRYDPLASHQGYVAEGIASWYGKDFHGKFTSNGEIYDMYALTAAHKTLPLGVYVRVTNLTTGKNAVLRVNDRGPFVKGRLIDLSYAGAKALDVIGPGTAPVRVEALGYEIKERGGAVAYRQPESYAVGRFSVQIGAFAVADNARRLATQLRSTYGFTKVQEARVNGSLFHRVWVGKYDSLDQAEAAKVRLEQNGYPSCFISATE